jgi:hypothetical protein
MRRKTSSSILPFVSQPHHGGALADDESQPQNCVLGSGGGCVIGGVGSH